MRNLLLLGFFLFFSSVVFGQIERSIFEAFDLTEINKIQINLSDSVKIEYWPGDNILVESNIAFYNGTKNIFEKLIKKGRYKLVEDRTTQILVLSDNGQTKQQIAGKNGEICDETIERTIYIPEDYAFSNGVYVKVDEE
ncbi:MAG TPA: hypothetical protein ENK85_09655 [Saprospiraceae bacterium]|nr:hypothetical protein [Saprospiraceae bacterium]